MLMYQQPSNRCVALGLNSYVPGWPKLSLRSDNNNQQGMMHALFAEHIDIEVRTLSAEGRKQTAQLSGWVCAHPEKTVCTSLTVG